MEFAFTEEHLMIRDSAERFLAQVSDSHAVRAAMSAMAVTSLAPRSRSRSIAVTRVPPVASMGSQMINTRLSITGQERYSRLISKLPSVWCFS